MRSLQIDTAALRMMMREDAIGLVLGVLLIVTALLAVAAVGFLRRRGVPLLWLAAFSLIYGFRLLVRTGTFRLCFDLPDAVWQRADAALTYTVPIPITLFARAMFPAWRRFWTFGVVGLALFALYGIGADAIFDRAFSARTANNVIAIGFFVGVVTWALRPRQPPTRELRIVRIGALTVSLAAVADNLRGIGLLAFPGPELEPFGFVVLIGCLGTVAVWRVLGDAERLGIHNPEFATHHSPLTAHR